MPAIWSFLPIAMAIQHWLLSVQSQSQTLPALLLTTEGHMPEREHGAKEVSHNGGGAWTAKKNNV